ncbi:MAG: haloacid dehalogenase type II [Acidobacteria bacterium]|nr:haloacid dehalogenase type II [Acidobacteriota bacterium]
MTTGEQGSKQRIKALVFDAYGTLFNPYTAQTVSEELFPGRGSELVRLWRAKQLEYTWLRSLMGRYSDFWEVTRAALEFSCRALNLSCTSSIYERLMQTYLEIEPYPEIRQALQELSSDYPLAILSNGTPEMLQAAVKSSKLEGVFSHLLSVDEVKIFKTSPRVYQLAPEKIGVGRGEIAFVSSNYWDAVGAKAFGFWTCWVNRSNAPPEELGLSPDATVSSISDLAKVLPH